MSQLPYSANLSSGFYPFLSRWESRTVIIPGHDEFYVRKLALQDPNVTDNEGIAQVYYSENVMPSANGIQSIGYALQLAGLAGKTDFSDIFFLRDINENKFLFSPGLGSNYVYNGNAYAWSALGGPKAPLITVAYINGLTYLFFQGVGCYQYNSTTNTLDAVTFTGVTASLLNGICASSGYLLAWDNFTVYRSQPTSILNFTPDPTQGSGASIPQDLKGQIVCCLPIFGGFIIYTTKNAVSASFSQNIRYPFIYKEVPGSSGIQNPNQVAWQENTGVHYAWTQSGMQMINKTSATGVFNPVTDFLTCNILETFNSLTNILEETRLTAPMQVRVSVVAQSWLVISYGINAYTHAVVYDLNYKRWGKLKISHAAAFELVLPNLNGDLAWSDLGTLSWTDLSTSSWADMQTQLTTFELPNTGLAFLGLDGTVTSVDFSETTTNDTGVLFLGKYQYVRDSWLSVQEVNFECIDIGDNFQLFLANTLDGKNVYSTQELYLSESNGLYRKYNSETEGLNLTLIAKGTFHLSSLDMQFKVGGKM